MGRGVSPEYYPIGGETIQGVGQFSVGFERFPMPGRRRWVFGGTDIPVCAGQAGMPVLPVPLESDLHWQAGGKPLVTRHQVGSRNPDTRFDRTYSSVRVHGPKVTVVQKRHGRQHQSRSSPQRARGNPCGCFGVVGPTRAAKIQTLLASRIRCILTDQCTRHR